MTWWPYDAFQLVDHLVDLYVIVVSFVFLAPLLKIVVSEKKLQPSRQKLECWTLKNKHMAHLNLLNSDQCGNLDLGFDWGFSC